MTDTQFGQMVQQYERLVYTICYQFTKDHHIAEDLSQETFLSAYSHLSSCPEENAKPWLARIATNKAKDHLKSAYHRKIIAADQTTIPEEKGALFIQDTLPEDITLSRDTVQRIEEDIRALKEPYHQVAVLFFLNEFSVDEIAARLKRPPKTVHTQLYRAKRMLQEKLKGEDADGIVP